MMKRKQLTPKAQESKEHIFKTALILFSEKGFSSTTMRDIADKANITVGLTYRYYPSKEKLLEEIILNHAGFMHTAVGLITNKEDKNFKEKLKTFLKENYFELRLYFSIIFLEESSIGKKNYKMIREYFHHFENHILNQKKLENKKQIIHAMIGSMFLYILSNNDKILDDLSDYAKLL